MALLRHISTALPDLPGAHPLREAHANLKDNPALARRAAAPPSGIASDRNGG
jgi:hypothetical protein